MSRSKPQPSSPVFKAALLSVSLMMSEVGAVGPVLPYLAQRFPGESQTMIQEFMSITAITGVIATLSAGVIANTFGKRRTVLLGILLMVVGGIAPLVLIGTGNYALVLTARAIAGFGIGMLTPLGVSLVADFYVGSERFTLMGWQSGAVGLGNIVWTLIVSALMTFGWMASFWVYALGILIFALFFLVVPEPRSHGIAVDENEAVALAPAEKEHVHLPKGMLLAVVIMFLVQISLQSMGLSLPFLAFERHLADGPTVSLIGTANGIAAVIAGFVYPLVLNALRTWTGTIVLVVMGIGLFLGATATSLGMLFVAAVLVGLGFGSFMPFALQAINERATTANSALVTSLMFTGAAIAGFCAPFYYLLAGAVLGNHSPGGQFAASTVTVLIAAAAAAIYYRHDARWSRQMREQAVATAPLVQI